MKTFGITYAKWKRVSFYHWSWRTKGKDYDEKLFNKLKHLLQPNMLCFYSNEKIFCHCQMVYSQNKHLVHKRVFGWSRVMVTLCLHLSYHMTSDSIRSQQMSRDSSASWIEREDSTSDNRTLRDATLAELSHWCPW